MPFQKRGDRTMFWAGTAAMEGESGVAGSQRSLGWRRCGSAELPAAMAEAGARFGVAPFKWGQRVRCAAVRQGSEFGAAPSDKAASSVQHRPTRQRVRCGTVQQGSESGALPSDKAASPEPQQGSESGVAHRNSKSGAAPQTPAAPHRTANRSASVTVHTRPSGESRGVFRPQPDAAKVSSHPGKRREPLHHPHRCGQTVQRPG